MYICADETGYAQGAKLVHNFAGILDSTIKTIRFAFLRLVKLQFKTQQSC